MLKFLSLGSGSSGNSYFLFSDNYGVLIDSGLSLRNIKKVFNNYGLSLSQIKSILITHDHADHVKSVGVLSNDFDLPVYATEDVHFGIDRNYCVTTKINRHNIHIINKNKTFVLGPFEITPFHVPHDSMDNVGYSIQYADVNFCLITDAGHITSEFPEFISKANYVVLESNYDSNMLQMGPYPLHLKERIRGGKGHLSNHMAAELLANAATEKLKAVWLCHLSEENNHPELAKKTIVAHLREFGIIAGKDFEVDVLKRKLPSLICELKK